MVWNKNIHFVVVSVSIIMLLDGLEGWTMFHRGRGHGGMLGSPKAAPNTTAEWFRQLLDHFNPTVLHTWEQRYFTNASFYVRGGPVFLMIGGEGTADPIWMVTSQWIEYAQRYNALCFMLEHRYYGASHPTRDLSSRNLVYLSSEQALADLAYFIEAMTVKYEVPEGTKWIAFGGSYSGSLAAWLRAKYPHLVHGAVSASAPLLAKADFREYYRVVQDDLAMYNLFCVAAIRHATQELSMLLKDSFGHKIVNKLFNLCDPIDVLEKNDVSNLYDTLAGNLAGIAQYNGDNRQFEGLSLNMTLKSVCAIMDDESLGTPVKRYSLVNNKLLEKYNKKCLDYKYDKLIAYLSQTEWDSEAGQTGGRQWVYQTCTEFGFYQTSDLTAQVFGDYFPLDFFIQQCSDVFGPRYNGTLVMQGVKRTNTIYGALNIQATRVVSVHGSVDPWHVLGITQTIKKDSPAIYIKGTAHCADMYPSLSSDLPQLVAARKKISDLIGQWLGDD
ncbi:putative serine protease K12H4.7 [Zootermopsis nevadensis]|uniref:Putative serine protease K12H4.7 n=1 Tax=Zootermopsis nevadensis TaxID=136037 RepID=A0A067RFD1_ZOONE|nr:putative serine protease K12H4.7 [Zootermopsis nevadensis]XP_021915229.1 putative serine protease K12H4.7 [Zootermopsis nevadensis]XP_021915230.1 putative serine protease K12H4.7 [Zootermopsis nevadensis]KDR21723.1 Putative serine protease K12H4.7 [Zootermopsis nevadensis]